MLLLLKKHYTDTFSSICAFPVFVMCFIPQWKLLDDFATDMNCDLNVVAVNVTAL